MSSQMPSAVAWTLHASKVFHGANGDLIWLIANGARCARIIPSLERPESTFLMARPASGPIAGARVACSASPTIADSYRFPRSLTGIHPICRAAASPGLECGGSTTRLEAGGSRQCMIGPATGRRRVGPRACSCRPLRRQPNAQAGTECRSTVAAARVPRSQISAYTACIIRIRILEP